MGCRSDHEAKLESMRSRGKTTEDMDNMIDDDSVLERCYEQAAQLISMQLDMCNQALKQPTVPPLDQMPDSRSSFSSMLIESLSRLHSAVTALTHSFSSNEAELHSLKISNTLLKSIIRAREKDLETLGEDYYAFATQRVSWNDTKKRLSIIPTVQCDEPFRHVTEKFTDPDEEEVAEMKLSESRTNTFLESIQEQQSLEKFVLVLHLDSERQYENQQTVVKRWSHLSQSAQLVQGMSESNLENITLEGFLKAKLLKSNPIITYLASGVIVLDQHMPAYELFPVLFQMMDSAFQLDQIGRPFPEVVLDYISMTLPVKSKMHQFLGTLFQSLQTFYTEGDPYAVFFARMLRVFNPDPLLDTVTQSILSINTVIRSMTEKKKEILKVRMTDEETGGNVYLVSALECAFILPLSKDLKLFQHFLTCIKPAELTDLEWAAFVIACKAEYLMIDFTSVPREELQDHLYYLKHTLNLEAVAIFLPSEPLSPDTLTQLFNSRVFTEIKDLLFLPRGSVLDAFLQVYDLYVESLFTVIANISGKLTITRDQLDECLQQLSPTITEAECEIIWETALNLSNEEAIFPTEDAVHLAIITCNTLSIAVKPILMREGEAEIQLKTRRPMNFDYSHGRLSVHFPSEDSLVIRQNRDRRTYRTRVVRKLTRQE